MHTICLTLISILYYFVQNVFKRDKTTDDDKTIFFWYDGVQYWIFSYESVYQDRNKYVCQMRIESSGYNNRVHKII